MENFLDNTIKGTFGIGMLTITEPSMNKRNNPYYGRVKKATYTKNVALGYNYEKCVNIKLKKQGCPPTFVADKPKGLTWDYFPFTLTKDTDDTQYYLRVAYTKATEIKNVFILDNQIVTDENIIQDIKSYIKIPKPSKKQIEAGVSPEEEVIVKNYKVENVFALKQGEREYAKKEEYDMAYLKKFFNFA